MALTLFKMGRFKFLYNTWK